MPCPRQFLLPLLVVLLVAATVQPAASREEERAKRQFNGGSDPSFSAAGALGSPGLTFQTQECTEEPDIANARVSCGFSGCRVRCNSGYKTTAGLGSTTLACDHSSGRLTMDGRPWQPPLAACIPYCGRTGCQNGGRCLSPRICECVAGYTGDHCESPPEGPQPIQDPQPPQEPQQDPNSCPSPDFPVENAEVEVVRPGALLMVRCDHGHTFVIGGTVAYIQCHRGAWDHRPGIFTSGGALVCQESQCDPPCQNGGVCLERGVCDCPTRFWGPVCQLKQCSFPRGQHFAKSSIGGTLSRMKIECHWGHKLVTGRRWQTILCRGGEWTVPGRGLLQDNDLKCYREDQLPVA